MFISPARYVQGAGALGELAPQLRSLAVKSALLVGGRSGLAAVRAAVERDFPAADVAYSEELFGGESTDAEISRIAAIALAVCADAIVACGGGKAIDTVKTAAARIGAKIIVVPTVASNDSPCSSVAVVYNPDGTMNRLEFLGRSPELVLVDTRIIANAPVRQLVSGMGDALATYYEADMGRRRGAVNVPGGSITETAMTLAKLCRDTLFEFGTGAKIAVENKVVTPALDRVVEANVLLSGLGFESGAVTLAHGLSEGFHVIPACRERTHGELVAFGLLAMLILDGAGHAEFSRVLAFCREVGLPATLREIGAEPGALLKKACEHAARPGADGGFNAPPENDPERVYDAVLAADAVGRLI
jgi:glycerol dehydrogenase